VKCERPMATESDLFGQDCGQHVDVLVFDRHEVATAKLQYDSAKLVYRPPKCGVPLPLVSNRNVSSSHLSTTCEHSLVSAV
jgi:hypothetical protein